MINSSVCLFFGVLVCINDYIMRYKTGMIMILTVFRHRSSQHRTTMCLHQMEHPVLHSSSGPISRSVCQDGWPSSSNFAWDSMHMAVESGDRNPVDSCSLHFYLLDCKFQLGFRPLGHCVTLLAVNHLVISNSAACAVTIDNPICCYQQQWAGLLT